MVRTKHSERRQPLSRRLRSRVFRPALERLETRVTPSNVDVLSYHYDGLLSGNNNQESILTPANVNPTNFGRLYSQSVDGQIYASPLYKANLAIPGQGTHNVAFVVTEHDSTYAFDADTGARLWQRSFINPAAFVTSVPSADTSTNISPEYGITGTPVIDPATNTMYLVAQTKEIISSVPHYIDRLHAIDITTGSDRASNAVVMIGDSLNNDTTHNTLLTVPGIGAGTQNGMVPFNAFRQLQRPALTIVNGVVYVGFAGYNDQGSYHGWVVGYRASDLALQGFINFSPNARAAGIWQSGGGLATDGTNLYFATGNTFSGPRPGFSPADNNYGETVVKLTPSGGTLSVSDYFTPFNWSQLDGSDLDLGSGGTMLLPDAVGSAAHPHLMVETGKTGQVYLVDRDNLGHNRPNDNNQIVQQFVLGGPGVWGNPSFFLDQPANHSGLILYHGSQSDLKTLRITNGLITGVEGDSNLNFGFPGGQPIVSSNGASSGIVWDLQVDGTSGATILRAYNAEANAQHVLTELYDSTQTSQRDVAGGPVKFTPATETNGKVFVGSANQFTIYGLFPDSSAVPAAPTNLAGMGLSGGSQIQITWTNPSPGPNNAATGIKIERSTSPTTGFAQIAIVARDATTYTNTGLTAGTQYYYRIRATNQTGDSDYSNTAAVATRIASPQLAVVNLTHAEVDLAWQQTGNDHYKVERAFNGGAFATIADNIPITTTHYNDTDPTLQNNPGTYTYIVTTFNVNPIDSAVSNVVSITNAPITIDHSAGFATHNDLTGNGNTQFTNGLVRLTTNVNEHGTVFTNQRVNIDNFTTSFTFRIHDGSNPPADGFTFIIQNNTATALGGTGGALGYAGIGNSVAIKVDLYDNAGEGNNSTGIFSAGRNPTLRDSSLPPNPTPDAPDISIPIDESILNLKNANVKQIDLSYNGTTLHEVITDTVTHVTFMQDYAVNIPLLVGSDAAFVGFGGGTGGLNTLQDIQTWTFTPGLGIPGAPVSALAAASGSNVNLTWVSRSVNEMGFTIERSQNDLNHFQQIATTTAPRFTDSNVALGNYYYRVRAFNAQGNSLYSNIANIVIGPTSPFTDHSSGFADHADLQLNNGAAVAGTRLEVTDGAINEARTAWTTTKIGIENFSTSFLLQDRGVIGAADGGTFAVQNNDPTVVGGGGGGLGYSGIGRSVAIMFDLYSGGGHASTTNLLINGNKTGSIDMGPSGIVLGSNHPLRVDLAYDVTQLAFSETVTDTVTGAIFQHIYNNVNVPQIVGGQMAYVGFTGATGGESSVQDILSWSARFLDPVQPVSHVSVQAADTVAGTPVNVRVSALDAFNNVKASYTGTVHFASSDPQATLPADYQFTATDNGVHTFSGVVLRTAGTQTVSAQDTAMNLIQGSTTAVVTAAAASQLAVANFTVTAGQLQQFTVTALDPYGNVAPTFRGTVHLTSSDGRAILSPDATFTASDNGTHVFAAVLFTAGSQTITATDTATGAITGTQTVTVTPAAATSILVATSVDGSTTVAGAPFDITVTVEDAYGNIATNYTGTVHFSSADPFGASLPADYTFTAGDQGVHTFTGGATLFTAGTDDVTASDTANGIVGTDNVAVLAAAAASIQIGAPGTVTQDNPFTFTVTAFDPYGNVANNPALPYTGTVTFTSSDGLAQFFDQFGNALPTDNDGNSFYTFSASDRGQVTLIGILSSRGGQSITAVDVINQFSDSAFIDVESGGGAPRPGGGRGATPASAANSIVAQTQSTGIDESSTIVSLAEASRFTANRHVPAAPLDFALGNLDAFSGDPALDPLLVG